jgi:hypothetical protein
MTKKREKARFFAKSRALNALSERAELRVNSENAPLMMRHQKVCCPLGLFVKKRATWQRASARPVFARAEKLRIILCYNTEYKSGIP